MSALPPSPSTGNILWLGSNVLATLIPIASLLGLLSAGDTSSSSSSMGAAKNHTSTNSKRSTAATILSSLAQGGATSGGLQSRVEYVMGWLERSIEHLPNFPRLHPQECVKRSICEAHHEPTKYGAIGLTLRLLFPATNSSIGGDETDTMEYKVINKYRHAAGYGQSRRLDSANGTSLGGTCKDKYEDCLVSLLDLGQNLVDFFLRQ